MADVGAVLEEELALAGHAAAEHKEVVLVEGESDRAALHALMARSGLESDQVAVIAMAGATNIGRFLDIVLPSVPLALCDEAERPIFESVLLRRMVPTSNLFVCSPDLEGEMIAALGPDRILELIESEGEGAVFARMRAQPAQRQRPLTAQLHRFIGTRSGRKIRYGSLTAGAIALDELPEGLRQLLHSLRERTGPSC